MPLHGLRINSQNVSRMPMNTTLIFLALFTANLAQAQSYLCSDGTRITRNSQVPTIHVTIDGVSLICKFTATQPGPNMCSVNSEPACANAPAFEGDCKTRFGEYGKCNPGSALGSDGNASCSCGLGE
jgi:hypothetical protein